MAKKNSTENLEIEESDLRKAALNMVRAGINRKAAPGDIRLVLEEIGMFDEDSG